MTLRVTLLPGDGIGPEIVENTVRVLDALLEDQSLDIHYTTLLVGGAALDAFGVPLREEDLETCRHSDAVLLGAVGGPAWDGVPADKRPERGLLRLRSALNLGINYRPITWTSASAMHSPLRAEVAQGADIAFIRELTGGLYFGKPSYIERGETGREAVDTAHYSEAQIIAVLEFAYELARTRRAKVTSVDKANVMQTSRLWREVATEYGAQHPDVQLEHALVDSFALAVLQDPCRYDVVVTENLFGDILTDMAGAIAGSLGLLPSASLGPVLETHRLGLYEPIHGSAPTLAGKNAANPVGCILSAALLLEWSLDQPELARQLREAVSTVMADGYGTADVVASGRTPESTSNFVTRVIDVLRMGRDSRADRFVRHHVA